MGDPRIGAGGVAKGARPGSPRAARRRSERDGRGEAPAEPVFVTKEADTEVRFRALVAGFTWRDIEITLAGDQLVVQGERRGGEDERRDPGRFIRCFTLPADADPEGVTTILEDDVLTILVPRLGH